MKKDATKILKRYEGNPIIKPQDYPGIAQFFNPSPVMMGDETIVLVSVVEHAGYSINTGYWGDTHGQTRVARSKDGINFTIDEENFIRIPKDFPFATKFGHYIDNRVTKIDDTYYIVTPAIVATFTGPCAMLGKTKDFKEYEFIDVIGGPVTRGTSLFPEKINGKYYKLDRPGAGSNRADIWISSSPDMKYWGEFKPVQNIGYSWWNQKKIGPTPPIKTDKGWLVIVHGVTETLTKRYSLGAMLLDLDEPWKVIGKTMSPILSPDEPYEQWGNAPNCVFACGAIGDIEKDELRLYYGAADERICLATGKLSEIVDACIEGI